MTVKGISFEKRHSVEKRCWLRKKFTIRKHEVFEISSPEFQSRAEQVTGLEWDFQKLHDGSFRCCVRDCNFGRIYGHWTCSEHLLVEFQHFDPVDDRGNLFWSHQEKKEKIAKLVKAE